MKKSNNNISVSEPIVVPARGKSVNVMELAEILDIEQTTIRAYIAEGMPVYRKGGKGVAHVLSTRDCVDWIVKRETDDALSKFQRQNSANGSAKSEDGDRLRQIKIEKAEIELAETRGDLFHLNDWVPLIEEACLAARQRFANIGGEFQSEFSDAPQVNRMSRWINNTVNEAMRFMSRGLLEVPERAEDAK